MQQGIDFQAWIWANFLLWRMRSGGAEFPGVTAIFLIDLVTELDTMKIKHRRKLILFKVFILVHVVFVKLELQCQMHALSICFSN